VFKSLARQAYYADASTLFSSRVGETPARRAPRPRLAPSSLDWWFQASATPPLAVSEDPPGLRRARTLAHLLDDAVRLPGGVRVGLDPLLSVLPVAGDLAAAVLSTYVVAEAWRAGVPRRTLARMLLNVAVDVTLGSVPVLGTAADVLVRANQRNVALFEAAVSSRASRPRP